MTRLILASASPRRTDILTELEIDHTTMPADIDESVAPGERPDDYVLRMAESKARTVARRLSGPDGAVVLGADTVVTLDGAVFGKPPSEAEAVAMLTALGGRTHRVLSAVALATGAELRSRVVASDVTLRSITTAEARRYWATGEPVDKAGGYAIQGRAAVFVERISGSYSGIVGLPVAETLQLLAHAGIRPRWLKEPVNG